MICGAFGILAEALRLRLFNFDCLADVAAVEEQ
jgi:hypothetical protein